jgi:hypothetical protein
MDRTSRLARRNAKKEMLSPRAARLSKFRDTRSQILRDRLYSKYHWNSFTYHIEKSAEAMAIGRPCDISWMLKAASDEFPRTKRFEYNGEEWWISPHGFLAKDDGIVRGWVHGDDTVQWIKLVPVIHEYFIWV